MTQLRAVIPHQTLTAGGGAPPGVRRRSSSRLAGLSIDDALVVLTEASSGESVGATRTDDEGHYELGLPPLGRYVLTALDSPEADRLDDLGEELKKAVAALGSQYGLAGSAESGLSR